MNGGYQIIDLHGGRGAAQQAAPERAEEQAMPAMDFDDSESPGVWPARLALAAAILLGIAWTGFAIWTLQGGNPGAVPIVQWIAVVCAPLALITLLWIADLLARAIASRTPRRAGSPALQHRCAPRPTRWTRWSAP